MTNHDAVLVPPSGKPSSHSRRFASIRGSRFRSLLFKHQFVVVDPRATGSHQELSGPKKCTAYYGLLRPCTAKKCENRLLPIRVIRGLGISSLFLSVLNKPIHYN